MRRMVSSERHGSGGRPAPLWYPVVMLGCALVAGVVPLSIGASLTHFHGPTTLGRLTPALLLFDEVGIWLFFVGGTVFAAQHYWRIPTRVLVHLTIRPADLVIGSVVGVVGQLVVVPVLYLPFELHNPSLAKAISKPAQSLIGIGRGEGLVVVAFVVLIGAPIAEELFFRGLVLRTLADRLSSQAPVVRAVLSVGGSGLLFALAHFEPLQFAGLLVVGCAFGALVWITGRLGTSIVAHASFNLVALVALARLH
jgi:membrane protease YdiL (CAAX protease family)